MFQQARPALPSFLPSDSHPQYVFGVFSQRAIYSKAYINIFLSFSLLLFLVLHSSLKNLHQARPALPYLPPHPNNQVKCHQEIFTDSSRNAQQHTGSTIENLFDTPLTVTPIQVPVPATRST